MSELNLVIAPATEADIPAMMALENACFSDPWTKDMLSDVLKYPLYSTFFLEEEGQICGYACLIGIPYAEVSVANIAVDIPFRGKGLSKLLMGAMHNHARAIHAEESFLEVRVSNVAAISLYEKYGYEIFGMRAKYYPDGEDAYVMKKTL